MANEQNLIKNSDRSPSQRRENARKAGIASGVARRRRKNLSELAKIIAENPVPEAAKAKLAKMGIEDEDANNNALVAVSVYKKAIQGLSLIHI